ncbi:MAG: hypothetical protein Q9218_008008, partial [Villophora microphyllina]
MASPTSFREVDPEDLLGYKLSQILQLRRSSLGSHPLGTFACETIAPGQLLLREKAVAMVEAPRSTNQPETEYNLIGALTAKICLQLWVFPEDRMRSHIRDFSIPCPSTSVEAHFSNNAAAHYERRGFWWRMAMIKHSCVPNACISFIGDRAILTATRPIAENEEILVDYISHRDRDDFNSPADIQQHFQSRWGFTYSCQHCNEETAISSAIYQRRRIGQLRLVRHLIGRQGYKPLHVQMEELNRLRGAVDTSLNILYTTYTQNYVACVNASKAYYALACYYIGLDLWNNAITAVDNSLHSLGFTINNAFSETSPHLFLQQGMVTKEALRCSIILWVAHMLEAKVRVGDDPEACILIGLAARTAAKTIYRILVGSDRGFVSNYEAVAFAAIGRRCHLTAAFEALDAYGGDAALALGSLGVRVVLNGDGARLSEYCRLQHTPLQATTSTLILLTPGHSAHTNAQDPACTGHMASKDLEPDQTKHSEETLAVVQSPQRKAGYELHDVLTLTVLRKCHDSSEFPEDVKRLLYLPEQVYTSHDFRTLVEHT